MDTTRPTSGNRAGTVAAAAAALVLGALLDFAHIGAYMSGADVPAGILALKVVLGVAGLAAATGLWGRARWAVLLALAVAVINLLVGVWGFVESVADSGSTAEKTVTGLGVLISLAVIVLAARIAVRRTA